ncbi:hypothetical protein CBR_g8855 [Chara braunii]|uniref:Myb-like domain-containing protein n=1 Tax=Chara braunii TaxID=69332 RepID=A0A388KN01_CHABU|nr:hypothetical protein CBR_g8855 [Chara braunii]|eukprot:GBG71436.1 hypothetical protein CBR_g8855 [Chara braunii]
MQAHSDGGDDYGGGGDDADEGFREDVEARDDDEDIPIWPLGKTGGRGKGRSRGVVRGRSVGCGGRRGVNDDGGKSATYWSLEDQVLLVRCKREQEMHLAGLGHNYGRMRTKEWKWDDIAKRMTNAGRPKDADDCMKKWENLFQHYKKIQRFKNVSGQADFFRLSNEERKEHNFKFRMERVLYNETHAGMLGNHTIFPPNVADTGSPDVVQLPRRGAVGGESVSNMEEEEEEGRRRRKEDGEEEEEEERRRGGGGGGKKTKGGGGGGGGGKKTKGGGGGGGGGGGSEEEEKMKKKGGGRGGEKKKMKAGGGGGGGGPAGVEIGTRRRRKKKKMKGGGGGGDNKKANGGGGGDNKKANGGGGGGGAAGDEVGTFGQAADNDIDAIMPTVRVPDCEGVNHGEEFLLVGGVIHLRGEELLACEGDGVFARWSLGDREDLAKVLKVGLEGGAEDKDVIKVDDDADFEEVAEDVVHGRLEGGGGIDESEWHYEELVVPEPRAEGGFVGVLLADTDLVEATAKVDLGEVLGSTETIKELGNARPALQTHASVMKLPVAPMSRRARNLVVDAPRVAVMNLRWKRDELAVKMMVLRRRCSLPKRTSRSCRACSSTTSEKVTVDGFGRRLEEHGARGGVCDAWESSGEGGVTGGGEVEELSMPDRCPGDCVHDEGPVLVKGGDAEVVGRVEAEWRVWFEEVMEVVSSGVVWWKSGCGRGRARSGGGVESIVVKHAREEVSKGHVGFVGEGGCKVFVAYSFDAGDERKVGNDGVGEVVAQGADVVDEAVRETGLAEVAELFKVVVNGFLGAEGGSEKVGPLEEGVTWSSGGSTVFDFSHPPFGYIAKEAGGGNGEPVGTGHVVEVKRVQEDRPRGQ